MPRSRARAVLEWLLPAADGRRCADGRGRQTRRIVGIPGDGAAIQNLDALKVSASDDTEALLFDMI